MHPKAFFLLAFFLAGLFETAGLLKADAALLALAATHLEAASVVCSFGAVEVRTVIGI